MFVVILAVLAVALLASRGGDGDGQSQQNSGTGGGGLAKPTPAGGEKKDDVMNAVGAGLSGAVAVAGAMKAIIAAASGGTALGGAAQGGGVVAAEAGSGATSGGSSTLASVAVGLASVLAVIIVFAWIAMFVTIFDTMGVVAAKARKKIRMGVEGVKSDFMTRIYGTEREALAGLIAQSGGQITTESRGDQDGWDKITSVSGLTPAQVKAIAVVARVTAIEQVRGYNDAVANYFREEHGHDDAELKSFGNALPGADFEGVIADYYAAHPATTWGMVFTSEANPDYVGVKKRVVYRAETFVDHRDLMVGAGLAKQLQQAFFTGQLAGVRMVDLIPGRLTVLDGIDGKTMKDGLVANALTPAGDWKTAAINRTFFAGRLRQVSNSLFDDVAKLGYNATRPWNSTGSDYGPTYILKQPGA